MKLKKNVVKLKNVLKSLLILMLVSSCGTVKVNNQEWCGDMGELGASCFNTLNDQTRDIDKLQWDEMRFGMICGTAEVFADSKRTILQLCKAYKKCRYDNKTQIMTYTDKNKKPKIVFLFKRVNDFNVIIKDLKGE